MKSALLALFIGFALLVLLYFILDIYKSKTTIDIHLYDTYFVISYTSVVVFVILFLATFFSLGGVIGSFFKNRLFLILTVLLLTVDIYYIVKFYKVFKMTEITQLPKK